VDDFLMRYVKTFVVWLIISFLCWCIIGCHRVEFNTQADSRRKSTHVEQQQFAFFGAVPLSAPLSSKCRYGLGYAKVEQTKIDALYTIALGLIGGLASKFVNQQCDNPSALGCIAKTLAIGTITIGSVSTRTATYRCLSASSKSKTDGKLHRYFEQR
jgi:hypothetical protein